MRRFAAIPAHPQKQYTRLWRLYHFCGFYYPIREVIPIAIYHWNIGIVSRGKGKSAVAAAAYRSGEKLTNEWDGMTHDYTLDSESGSSLRAAGWNCAGLAGGKCWTGSRKYKATAYIRLSYTDDHSGESDSVSNQRKLIENFVERNPDIEVVSEKIDDGYSGIIFDRPAFKEMMQDVTDGNINCVIVKDLSRLGREYIETGRYLRRVFPAYGVRFIRLVAQTTTTEAAQSLLIFLEDRNIFTQFHTYQKSLFFVYCGAVFALA